MKLSSKTTSLVFAAVMTASSVAMAQDPPAMPPPEGTQPPPPTSTSAGFGMGRQGQIVLAADLPLLTSSPLFSMVRSSSSFMGASSSSWDITLAPSGDYFIAPNISVGALVGFSSYPVGAGDATTFGLMPRAGYSFPLTDVLSIWPRLGIGYFYTSVSPTGGGGSLSGYTIPFFVDLPILWHPAPHFFIGAGGMFKTELVNKVDGPGGTTVDGAKTTNLGLTTLIGGYFGG
jgi:hypothetical protein